jgi:hypothetical protein
MSYQCRIDECTTIFYDGKSVTITHEDNYWGRKESFSVPIKNIGLLIQALQDIQKMKYERW